ncbi:hypothetical protein EDD36DRAFT_486702 [Exophiala viscosa]|uniref:Uncharacterized protein n=1 Tax=Exophiala viscosa TaxID=2486360 RepID=A0AAN6DYK7_9EURO|nr:hypothetical protein EDD36DRAFT_486702 [Exophiala viscosa]
MVQQGPRWFDSVPHIVRFGMQDEDNGKSWTTFFRNGVYFTVNVDKDDVQDTPFGNKWLAALKKAEPMAGPDFMKIWIPWYEAFCDLIIMQSMPLLKELAPVRKHWETLEDHLRTPKYEVKMVAEGGDAVAKYESGPIVRPSYDYFLLPFDRFGGLPDPAEVRWYHARELTVLNPDKNWRSPPTKMRTGEGEVLYFVKCEPFRESVETGIVDNASIERINAHLRLYRQTKGGAHASTGEPHIPKLQGIVVSEAYDFAALGTQTLPSQSLAGILVTYVSKAKTLAEVKELLPDETRAIELKKGAEKWREQFSSVVQYLHDHGITIGARTTGDQTWYYINHYSMYLAPVPGADSGLDLGTAELADADASFLLTSENELHMARNQQSGVGDDGDRERFEEQKALDWEAVEKLFHF